MALNCLLITRSVDSSDQTQRCPDEILLYLWLVYFTVSLRFDAIVYGTFNYEDALVSHIKITFNIKIKLYIVVKCLKLLSHLQTICIVHEHTI